MDTMITFNKRCQTRSLLRIVTALLLLAVAPACKKDKDDPTPTTPAPVAEPGDISGTISPVGSITGVTATGVDGITFQATPDPATGVFTFTSLPAGTYTVSFTAAGGYAAPAAQTTNVVAGGVRNMGTVTVQFAPGTIRGTMTWKVNGITYSTNRFTGSFDSRSNNLNVSGIIQNGAQLDEMKIILFTGRGIGSYSISSGNNDVSFNYLRLNSGVFQSRYIAQYGSRGSGDLYLSDLSNNGQSSTLTCIFGFAGDSRDAMGNSIGTAPVVSDGAFTLTFY